VTPKDENGLCFQLHQSCFFNEKLVKSQKNICG